MSYLSLSLPLLYIFLKKTITIMKNMWIEWMGMCKWLCIATQSPSFLCDILS
jgi:hypothetical protein